MQRLRGVAQCLGDVVGFQVGIRRKDGLAGHPLCHHFNHRGDRDAQMTNAGHASHLGGIDGDMARFHGRNYSGAEPNGKAAKLGRCGLLITPAVARHLPLSSWSGRLAGGPCFAIAVLAGSVRMFCFMDLRWRLSHARGYIELGMWREAAAELDAIDPAFAESIDVLALRVALLHESEDWEQLQAVAGALTERQPKETAWWVSYAFATRRVLSVEAAKAVLLEAEKTLPDQAIIQFNLSCYACQLGELAEARKRVLRAMALDANFRAMAQTDPDLAPLREADRSFSD